VGTRASLALESPVIVLIGIVSSLTQLAEQPQTEYGKHSKPEAHVEEASRTKARINQLKKCPNCQPKSITQTASNEMMNTLFLQLISEKYQLEPNYFIQSEYLFRSSPPTLGLTFFALSIKSASLISYPRS